LSDDAEPNPTVARRRLAVRLSRLREQNGHSLEDLAKFLRVALPQASRLDTGARGVPVGQVKRLADWYGLSESERGELLELVAESRRRAWWQQVELQDSYRTLIGMEQAAESVDEYCSSVVPGLLQTYDYARAVAASSYLEPKQHQVDQAVEVRLRRQEILNRVRPPDLWVIIDESALARTTGGVDVMRAQLLHLEEMADRPRVTVQVVGFESGTHLGSMNNHFILLRMRGDIPDVLYSEAHGEPYDTSAEESISYYRRIWDMMRAVALAPDRSRARITSYLDHLHGYGR